MLNEFMPNKKNYLPKVNLVLCGMRSQRLAPLQA